MMIEIDTSIGTFLVAMICAALACIVSFKKYKNPVRCIFIFLWATAIYLFVACSIFPIRLYRSGREFYFAEQFSVNFPWHRYFAELFRQNFSSYMHYLCSFLSYAFFACILFKKLRAFKGSMLAMAGLMFFHFIYNIMLNFLCCDTVKYIRGEDFIFMAFGYIIGYALSALLFKLWPRFGKIVFEKRKEE